jgi:hypothetical protein
MASDRHMGLPAVSALRTRNERLTPNSYGARNRNRNGRDATATATGGTQPQRMPRGASGASRAVRCGTAGPQPWNRAPTRPPTPSVKPVDQMKPKELLLSPLSSAGCCTRASVDMNWVFISTSSPLWVACAPRAVWIGCRAVTWLGGTQQCRMDAVGWMGYDA